MIRVIYLTGVNKLGKIIFSKELNSHPIKGMFESVIDIVFQSDFRSEMH
jgi:hypothetical protein